MDQLLQLFDRLQACYLVVNGGANPNGTGWQVWKGAGALAVLGDRGRSRGRSIQSILAIVRFCRANRTNQG